MATPPLPPRPPHPEDEPMDLGLDAEPYEISDSPEEPEPRPVAPQGPKRFPCGMCGAELIYSPGTADIYCDHCGHQIHIPQSADEIQELDYEAHLSKMADASDLEEHEIVHCPTCGAETDKPKDLTAFACVFCGGKIVTQSETKRLIKPQSLLPFAIERREAVEAFRKWINSLWFAPNELKKFARMDTRIQGIYVPYWTYDAQTTTHYTGQRGEDYWVTVGSGKNRKRVRKTRWYSASGVVFNSFDDLLVLASQSLPRKYANKLEPWDLHALKPYDDRYLSGFLAESYKVTLPEGFVRACELMEDPIRNSIRADIGGDRQRIHSMSIEHKNVTFKHILLPVWMSAYLYRDKSYRFLINGRTGEVQGERPWSWWKIALAVLGGLVVLGIVIYLLAEAGVLDDVAFEVGRSAVSM